MKKLLMAALSAAAFIMFTGCQQAPNSEFEAARAALQRADSVEADVYLADLYSSALDSLNAAQVEIETQNAASGFSRDYTRAKELLAFTYETARSAETGVDEAREEIRAEADSLISVVQQAIAASPVVQTEDGGAPSVTALLNDAVRARDGGDYKTAHDLIQAAADQIAATPVPAADMAPRS
jgi:hypothetical protein